jgi:two-component system chemotaxis response regulator CheY
MKQTILFVDDSVSIRELVSHTLKSAGFDVLTSDDGDNALKLFDGRSIDLLITDLHMERMNGIQLTGNIRKMDNYKRIPIVVLTTESQLLIKNDAKAAGATAWITKPFNPENLVKVVNKLIRVGN